MLAELLLGLFTGGVFYVIQETQGWLYEEQKKTLPTKGAVSASLQIALNELLPKISNKIPEILKLKEEDLQALHNLFDQKNQWVDRLHDIIVDKLTMLSPIGHDSYIDVFSVEEIAEAIENIQEETNIEGLTSETLCGLIPRIIVMLLHGLGNHEAMGNTMELVRSIHSLRLQKDLHDILTLDEEEKRQAILSARKTLYRQACHAYAVKLAGKKPDLIGKFDYLPPGMRIVRRLSDLQISDQLEDNRYSNPIGREEFLSLLFENKRILLIAGAGVGKTTFLRRLHLALLYRNLEQAPLPIFQETEDFLKDSDDLLGRVCSILEKSPLYGLVHDKATSIARELNDSGRLCFLLDSVDQTSNRKGLEQAFRTESVAHIGKNIVIVACRSEEIQRDFERFKDDFASFQWIILEKFTENELKTYLGGDILHWLNFDKLPGNFRELLLTRFYSNITKSIGLRKDSGLIQITNRTELLQNFLIGLFNEARSRSNQFNERQEKGIQKFLFKLSFETLCAGHHQWFPSEFLEKYEGVWKDIYDLIFHDHWVFFNSTVFEGGSVERYSFYHQLLQEYFAARYLKDLFESDVSGFEKALVEFPFSPELLDILDELLSDHKKVFDFCMECIRHALAEADAKKTGLANTGHKFTWLLALRDKKGENPELSCKLHDIFYEEMKKSQETDNDGIFIKIPGGSFLMGGYLNENEQPVRVGYLFDYWIGRHAITFDEYDLYCEKTNRNKPSDGGWGRGNRPVINVNWTMAKSYASWLGKKVDLPTEIQWEKAARGRLGRQFPWGNKKADNKKLNFKNNNKMTMTVDSYEPYMYGLFQMSGNVWEWCLDGSATYLGVLGGSLFHEVLHPA